MVRSRNVTFTGKGDFDKGILHIKDVVYGNNSGSC